MKRTIWFWCVTALIAAGALARAAESLRIVPIVHDDEVLVSFELADAYNSEVRSAVASGLRTAFTYDIELRMVAPLWLDRTIATAVVSVSDQYDNLTRRHSLVRTLDGGVEDASVTEDEDVAKRWLTILSRVPLCRTSKLEPNRDYYVRVTSRAHPRRGSLLAWVTSVTGQAKFTFIP
jgi:uncharacterized protein DUF4390